MLVSPAAGNQILDTTSSGKRQVVFVHRKAKSRSDIQSLFTLPYNKSSRRRCRNWTRTWLYLAQNDRIQKIYLNNYKIRNRGNYMSNIQDKNTLTVPAIDTLGVTIDTLGVTIDTLGVKTPNTLGVKTPNTLGVKTPKIDTETVGEGFLRRFEESGYGIIINELTVREY